MVSSLFTLLCPLCVAFFFFLVLTYSFTLLFYFTACVL